MSSRQERNTRSNGRHDSVTVPETTRSSPAESSEGEGPTARELRRTRSQRRDHIPQGSSKHPTEDTEKDAEEDVTRCICRLAEYPGPPYGNDRNLQDGGFFIQCEKCNVWQHAGCVGFFDEDACPRHYYCETCRPDLHKIITGKLGYQCSHYGRANGGGPVPPSSNRPPAKESDSRSSKERDGKANAAANSLATAKRRATMNSRAAYDDEEVLRIIEESKRNGGAVESTNGSRKSKRGREDSEETEHEQKRRKTGSSSGSPVNGDGTAIEADSDADDSKSRSHAAQSSKRSKAVSQTNANDKDPRRRDRDNEQERLDIAARRKSRSERRRGDEAEVVDDTSKALSPSKSGTTSSKSSKLTSSKQAAPTSGPTNSSKRSSKPSTRRGKVGRNQYTKERDALADARASEARPSHSRDGEDGNGSSDGQTTLLPNGSKPAKPKYMNPNRTSMNELRKRAAGILEFISRTQIEMAVDKPPSDGSTPPLAPPTSSSTSRNGSKATSNGTSKLSNEIHSDAIEDATTEESAAPAKPSAPAPTSEDKLKVDEDTFKGLDTVQMMDVLSRDIHLWQQLHGKWGSAKEVA